MLPPGHVAAGYLTAVVAVKIFHPNFDQHQINSLLFWGMFWGFCPDLDVFYSFYKIRGFTSDSKKADHRKFISHAPLLWLFVGIVLYFLMSNPFWKFNIILMVAGTWSHLLLDSIEYGIPWLWPFSHKLYALINPGQQTFTALEKSFFKHWISFVKFYITRPTFYLEIIVIMTALIIFKSFYF
jgi:hypothetical protein